MEVKYLEMRFAPMALPMYSAFRGKAICQLRCVIRCAVNSHNRLPAGRRRSNDGCFLMTGQELATVVQYELPVIIILVNNGMLGTIRMHRERRYPGRVSGADLVNPAFCEFATAFGVGAERVQETKEFIPALKRSMRNSRPIRSV